MDLQLRNLGSFPSANASIFLRLQSSFLLSKILTGHYFSFNDVFYLMKSIILRSASLVHIGGSYQAFMRTED